MDPETELVYLQARYYHPPPVCLGLSRQNLAANRSFTNLGRIESAWIEPRRFVYAVHENWIELLALDEQIR
jgi:hypothetical protein